MLYLSIFIVAYLVSAYGVWRWIRDSRKPEHFMYGLEVDFAGFAAVVIPVWNTAIFLTSLLISAKTGETFNISRFYRAFFKLPD